MTDEAQVEATLRAGVDRFGRLDMAFNNAGIMIPPLTPRTKPRTARSS